MPLLAVPAARTPSSRTRYTPTSSSTGACFSQRLIAPTEGGRERATVAALMSFNTNPRTSKSDRLYVGLSRHYAFDLTEHTTGREKTKMGGGRWGWGSDRPPVVAQVLIVMPGLTSASRSVTVPDSSDDDDDLGKRERTAVSTRPTLHTSAPWAHAMCTRHVHTTCADTSAQHTCQSRMITLPICDDHPVDGFINLHEISLRHRQRAHRPTDFRRQRSTVHTILTCAVVWAQVCYDEGAVTDREFMRAADKGEDLDALAAAKVLKKVRDEARQAASFSVRAAASPAGP